MDADTIRKTPLWSKRLVLSFQVFRSILTEQLVPAPTFIESSFTLSEKNLFKVTLPINRAIRPSKHLHDGWVSRYNVLTAGINFTDLRKLVNLVKLVKVLKDQLKSP